MAYFVQICADMLLRNYSLTPHCDHASIWHRYRAPQSTCTHKHKTTDRTTDLLISSSVHYVHTWRR